MLRCIEPVKYALPVTSLSSDLKYLINPTPRSMLNVVSIEPCNERLKLRLVE
jgi:hypothetical protein